MHRPVRNLVGARVEPDGDGDEAHADAEHGRRVEVEEEDAPTACAEQGEDGGEGLEYVAGKLDDDCGAEGAYQLDQHEQPR